MKKFKLVSMLDVLDEDTNHYIVTNKAYWYPNGDGLDVNIKNVVNSFLTEDGQWDSDPDRTYNTMDDATLVVEFNSIEELEEYKDNNLEYFV